MSLVEERTSFLEIEPPDILNEEVLVTMVGGKVVYESPNWTNLKVTGTN